MAAHKKTGSACVALLRGINVGGKNVIKMEALRASFETMGFSAVRTLIASGNVVFRGPHDDARKLEPSIEKVLSKRHAYAAKVVVRNLGEYEKMMRAIPPKWGGDERLRYYVVFLRHAIDRASLLDELDVKDGVEEVKYVPGALLWSARIDKLTESRMSKAITKPIYQDMTIRNLSTTRKILELLKKDDD